MTDLHQANIEGGAEALSISAKTAMSADKPFAIMRYAKLKTMSAIKGSSGHMRRAIVTPNADPDRTSLNVVLIGSNDPAADAKALIPKMGRADPDDPTSKLLRRSNSVLTVEVLMTTSPQWWETATADDRDNWIAQSTEWLAEEWGADNIAHLELHVDETTTHLTGFIVPLDAEGGLNARKFIGGKASKAVPGSSLLSGHQTRYAESVENLGLRRGRLGSTATHETVQGYYKRITHVEENITVPQIGVPPLLGREQWAEDMQARVTETIATIAAQASEAATERRRANSMAKTADNALSATEASQAARKALSDKCRNLDLETVISDLGFEFDKSDQRWKIGADGSRDHLIELKNQNRDTGTSDDQKWRCAVLQSGGRGAIDLVKAVQGTDFNGALAYLSNRYGLKATASAWVGQQMHEAEARVKRAVEICPAFKLPEASPDNWQKVRAHLIKVRGIDPEVLDQAHADGDIYAQEKAGQHGPMVNAVFVCRDADGEPTGAEIKSIRPRPDGTYWGACAVGTNKKAGGFRAGIRDLAKAARVVVVESAIDALSALGWIKRDRGYDGAVAVISTAGDGLLPEPLLTSIPATAKKFAGQDANIAGNRQARKMGEDWKRLTPPKPHTDWNKWSQSVRLKEQESASMNQPAPDIETPTLE